MKYQKPAKDCTNFHRMIEENVRIISAEIVRLCRIGYYSENNRAKILELEEFLAAYERDLQKYD